MADGSPVVVQRVVNNGHTEDFTLISPEGWSCKTQLHWDKDIIQPRTTTARLPLACDNKMSGNALITVPTILRHRVMPGQSSITFSLRNGRSGMVIY